MFSTILIFAAYITTTYAGCVTCPNQCSGHGTCNLNFVCACYDNYGIGLSHDSGDCSERICPYELAWVDTPDILGKRHKYAECAGKGICNRDTGECECFAGYQGKACARSTCPNDCSGHGRCAYIQDLSYGATSFDSPTLKDFSTEAVTFDYYQWDLSKTRGCVCDAGYADVDCSKHLCPHGTDVMNHRQNMLADQVYQTQHITFHANFANNQTLDGKTFALTFKSKLNETFTTIPIHLHTTTDDLLPILVKDVQSALEGLPNGVIDAVQVHAASLTGHEVYLNISFTGDYVQGPQYLLGVEADLCGDGCTPKLTGMDLMGLSQSVTQIESPDFQSYECGRRGKCDYTTGVCACFEGYAGQSCGSITALI